MTSRVYRLHSTLELPLEDTYDFFEEVDLPEEIADVDITRRNNTLIISAVAATDEISKYTPTAQLKASVTENRVYEEEPEEAAVGGPPSGPGGGGPSWGSMDDEEEEIPSELVEYACFKGDRETVLQNTALQYPMFEVLHALALQAEKGALTAIACTGDDLEAVRVVDGEDRPATINVTEDPQDDEGEGGVNWRENEFIS